MIRVLMRRIVELTIVLAVLAPAPAAMAQEREVVPLTELLANPAAYDNEEVTVRGELVGDYGFRRDGTMWTQLNDDSYARQAVVDGGPLTGSNVGIGVRMPAALGEDLDPVGGYRLEGPIVRLTGTWRYHDPDRGGESYLDVAELAVVEQGRRLNEGPDWVVFTFGAVLVAASLLMWWMRRSEMEQR